MVVLLSNKRLIDWEVLKEVLERCEICVEQIWRWVLYRGVRKPLNVRFVTRCQRLASAAAINLNAPEFGSAFEIVQHTTSDPKQTRTQILRKTKHYGSYQADSPQVNRRQGPKEAAGHQGSSQVRTSNWRSQETSQVSYLPSTAPSKHILWLFNTFV